MGRCVSSKCNQKMMGVTASGYDRGVWKDHGCGHFPPGQRGSDVECRAAFASAKGAADAV